MHTFSNSICIVLGALGILSSARRVNVRTITYLTEMLQQETTVGVYPPWFLDWHPVKRTSFGYQTMHAPIHHNWLKLVVPGKVPVKLMLPILTLAWPLQGNPWLILGCCGYYYTYRFHKNHVKLDMLS